MLNAARSNLLRGRQNGRHKKKKKSPLDPCTVPLLSFRIVGNRSDNSQRDRERESMNRGLSAILRRGWERLGGATRTSDWQSSWQRQRQTAGTSRVFFSERARVIFLSRISRELSSLQRKQNSSQVLWNGSPTTITGVSRTAQARDQGKSV